MTQHQIEERKQLLKAVLDAEIKYQQTSPYLPMSKIVEDLEKELNQDFFSDNNAVQKIPEKKITNSSSKGSNYSPTKVKARNFLTSVSYSRVKDIDFDNKSFVIDCYTFLLLNLNLFYLERNFESVMDRQYVEVIWNSQIPNDFYTYICQPEHYQTLNKLKLKFQDAPEIVKSFAYEPKRFQQLQAFLKKNVCVFQFVYVNLFPRYFSRIVYYGIQSRLEIDSLYKNYSAQKNIFNWQYSASNIIKNEETDSVEVIPETNDEIAATVDKIEQIIADGTAEEKIFKKKKNPVAKGKKIKKRQEKRGSSRLTLRLMR